MEVQEGRKGIPSLLSSQGECIASNITQLIGWTPLIELKNVAKKDGIDARLIGKIEPYWPVSSVKDRSKPTACNCDRNIAPLFRIAAAKFEAAKFRALPHSGPPAAIYYVGSKCSQMIALLLEKGYRFLAVMPAKIAIDKQILLRYLGVEVILVDATINGFKGLLVE
ncbi:unnamed protein product [Miscanthus lutarioriparius]|uniref:Uncharacterized protein n=1 Tax=Miscanthus lutarioriparius TaxID=422564 RepID=A0A811PXN8_9POAL|nr:unnamed protein product [Miscanthus lutarioriparius]